jgi:hypothetical protein
MRAEDSQLGLLGGLSFLCPTLTFRGYGRCGPPKRPAVSICNDVRRTEAVCCNSLGSASQRPWHIQSPRYIDRQTCSARARETERERERERGTSLLESKQKTKIYFGLFLLRGVVGWFLFCGLPRGRSAYKAIHREVH